VVGKESKYGIFTLLNDPRYHHWGLSHLTDSFHLGSIVIQIKFSYSFLMLDLMCVHRYRVIYRLVNTVYVLGITSADLDDVDSNIFACACMVNQAVRSLFVLPLHPVFLVGLRGNPLSFSQYHCDLPKNKKCS
jgi:hypothetical protein